MGVLDFVELSTHRDYVLFGHGKFGFGFLSLFINRLYALPLLLQLLNFTDDVIDVDLGLGICVGHRRPPT